MRWAYGVTTVASRRSTHLPRTLRSLTAAGFPEPRLFVDGTKDPADWECEFKLPVTARWPNVFTHLNWHMALLELFGRSPACHRYAVFQDDVLFCRDLRRYLEYSQYPDGQHGREKGYWNLYTVASYHTLPQASAEGWFKVPAGNGRGALALVFDRDSVFELLASPHFTTRPADVMKPTESVDGGIVDSMNKVGRYEFAHNPSLVQHTGEKSTMGHMESKPTSPSFRGEEFSALSLRHTVRSSGEAAYEGHPRKEELVLAWRNEVEAVRRAIIDDERRLAEAKDGKTRRKLMAYIASYRDKLNNLQVNNPPYGA